MNCRKTFCQTSTDNLKKRCCCHKCCECTECTSHGSVPQSRYMHTAPCGITALISSFLVWVREFSVHSTLGPSQLYHSFAVGICTHGTTVTCPDKHISIGELSSSLKSVLFWNFKTSKIEHHTLYVTTNCHIVTYNCMICDIEFGHVTAAIEGSTFQFSFSQFDCRVAPERISGIPSSI